MNINKFSIIGALLLATSCSSTMTEDEFAKTFRLIPTPQQVELTGGTAFGYNKDIPVVCTTITEYGVPDNPEGYVLTIDKNGATISARTEDGLFYGQQTLKQIIQDSKEQKADIPALCITDYPAIAVRSIHIDTKHHVDTPDYYRRLFDNLASWKINSIIWELEDKLQYKSHPEVSGPNAFPADTLHALSEYAKERHIRISPLIQGLGHASYILKHHKELRENPNSDWEMCPSNEATYQMLFDLYGEALEVFNHAEFLHVGGDEISSLGTDKLCKDTGLSAFELQMKWLKRVNDYAVAHGVTPVFWDDMPLKYAGLWPSSTWAQGLSEDEIAGRFAKLEEAIDLFPKDCLYMRWQYGDASSDDHRRIVNWYGKQGLKVMAASAAAYGNSPFLPRDGSLIGHLKQFSGLVADNHLYGILATCWDDGSPHMETVMRGFAAHGQYTWNPVGDIEDYKDAFAQRYLGLEQGSTAFIDTLEQAYFFFDGALVSDGRRNPAWGTRAFTLIDLPDASAPGAWTEKNAELIAKAEFNEGRYAYIKEAIDTAKKNALRGNYLLDVYEQLNELQHFPVTLLQALRDYDNQVEGSREKVLAVCNDFETMRIGFEKVYTQTRSIEQPERYLPDNNLHAHLAIVTLNSDWMYLYEVAMIKAIREKL